jgi:hypothetical protein
MRAFAKKKICSDSNLFFSSQNYSKMTSKARINVSQFVGFPSSPPDKTLTEEFIIAANEVIEMMKMIGSFTKPITADMKKNLNTIESYYNEDKENMKYLEDMPFSEKVVHAYLVWLLRSLDLVSRFLLFAAKDEDLIKEKNNNLRPFLNQAYEETTLPYHGFILQKTFKVSLKLTFDV